MADSKQYALLLSNEGVALLRAINFPALEKLEDAFYIMVEDISPNGAYFHVTMNDPWVKPHPGTFEMHLPHAAVIAAFSVNDIRRKIGFA